MLKLSKISPDYSTKVFQPAPIASWDDFSPSDYLLTVKGAPEVLFPRCSYVVAPGGGPPIPLTPPVLARIVAIQESWASQGRRVLVLARKVVKEEEVPKEAQKNSHTFQELVNDLNEDLVIVGLVGLIDPLKDDIVDTVRSVAVCLFDQHLSLMKLARICRGAGIRFFVVTGKQGRIRGD
jgi:sodium/potassium-transporting ATPase subunit alpha